MKKRKPGCDDHLPCENEALDQAVAEMVSAVSTSDEANLLDDFFQAALMPPTDQGLYALMSPDGIMVKVVDKTITKAELENMIWDDISTRVMREYFEPGKQDPSVRKRLIVDSFPEYLRLRKLYRLERIGG